MEYDRYASELTRLLERAAKLVEPLPPVDSLTFPYESPQQFAAHLRYLNYGLARQHSHIVADLRLIFVPGGPWEIVAGDTVVSERILSLLDQLDRYS